MDFERTGRFRAQFLCGALLVLLAALLGRLAQIQIVNSTQHASGAWRQQVSRREIPAFRGRILDRNGFPLALSVPARSLHADPGEVEDVELAAARVAPLLGFQKEELISLLDRPGRFVPLRRRIEDRDLLLRIAKLDLPWIGQTYEPSRNYPAGRLAAHVLGFTGVDGDGLWGLEAKLESRLAPTKGVHYEERDATRRAIRLNADGIPACAGEDVALTLDRRIQSFAEEALDTLVADWTPKAAVAVVMDPYTGDILASAVRPTFDPAHALESPKDHWLNRTVTHAYEVGSSLKPLVAAVALEAGVISPGKIIDCKGGRWRFRRTRVINDCHKMGRVPLREVLIHSSNIGMVQIADWLGPERLRDGLARLGFGRTTRSGFPAESVGVLSNLADWTGDVSLRSVAFGQEVAVTPIQLARAYCAVATDGRAPRPRWLLTGGPPVRTRLFDAGIAAFLRETMAAVVEEGTGRKARLTHWRVGGKTGTADRMTPNGKDGYISSFVALAPVGDPRFVVVVIADRPRTDKGCPYGGSVAAPAVKTILEQALRLTGAPSDAN